MPTANKAEVWHSPEMIRKALEEKQEEPDYSNVKIGVLTLKDRKTRLVSL